MARLNTIADPESSSFLTSTTSRTARQSDVTPLSPTPSASSDKENQYQPNRQDNPMEHAAKRRRTGEHPRPIALPSGRIRADENPDLKYYDPNQNIEERRQVRKGLRDLNKEAQDLRQEWLAPQSTGLVDAVTRAEALFHSVKQTSDATIDSRLLVTAADIAYRKTQSIVLGDGVQGIDVDEFVSKCISFMNRAGGEEQGQTRTTASQRRRRRATQADDSDDDEEHGPEAGDALNWEWLGAHACFPSNSRPPVPGFLLGPLSVQKRTRPQRARRERLQRAGPVETTRPDELNAADLQRAENSTLTTICGRVHAQYVKVQAQGMKELEQIQEEGITEDTTEEEMQELFNKHNIAEDQGVPLFRFALHPTSFGQTVENLFYVSFLIKEGMLGICTDSNGMPTLHNTVGETQNTNNTNQSDSTRRSTNNSTNNSGRHQAVFSLDFETWQELVKVFKITEPAIPDRSNSGVSATQIGDRGWYA